MSNLQNPNLADGQSSSTRQDSMGATEVLEQVFEMFRTGNLRALIDPDFVVVEMTGHGTVMATGDTFSRRYIDVCRTKNGRIQFIRDYWNPQESPKLNLVKKLKVAYRMIGGNLKSLRHPRRAE